MSLRLLTGDVLKCLAKLPDESVQCVVTSPPYWALRDYGTATWKGGNPDCDHKVRPSHAVASSTLGGGKATTGHWQEGYRDLCGKCGARRIDAQLGLEPTPEAYVAKMVAVFAEVRRILRPDGTCWVNLGDSYANNGGGAATTAKQQDNRGSSGSRKHLDSGLKPKDLVGIPWRVAFALQADGWYLRSDIIWHKPNPMPESVRDRPTKSHEYIFLLTKRARYYYDAEAVKEAQTGELRGRTIKTFPKTQKAGLGIRANDSWQMAVEGHKDLGGRNLRSVWSITPKPFRGAHFATFPPALVERCVKAGTSERGACPTCGAPWERVTDGMKYEPEVVAVGERFVDVSRGDKVRKLNGKSPEWIKAAASRSTLGWRPTCSCPAAEPVPCVVLDPFSGAGTVALVCRQLGRSCIGIDLNPSYNRMARRRIAACPRPA